MADTPLMFHSPKQSYLADERQCRRHLDLLANETLARAFEIALAQQQWILCHSDSPDFAAKFHMMKGALHFLETFHHLATPPPSRQRSNATDLNHGA